MSEARQYCSLQDTGFPMAGTSDQVDCWLLLEYTPSWSAKVLEDNALSSATQAWLADSLASLRATGRKVRPQFIRQPELDRNTVRCILAAPQASWYWEGQGYNYLHDLDFAGVLEKGGAQAKRLDQPLYFVCMNGQRDVCCARFGRPVYQALREQVGERVWQISHLGGHRFAPNVLTLPDAAMYGRLSPESVQQFVGIVERGELDFEHLRGRSWYSKLVQAAEVYAARQGLTLVSSEELDVGAKVAFDTNSEAGRISVAVRRAEQPRQVLASCRDSALKNEFPIIPAQ